MRKLKRISRISEETKRKAVQMRRDGIKYWAIAYELGISNGTIHRYVKLDQQNK